MGLHRYMLDKSWDYIGTLSGPVPIVVGLHKYAHIPSEADLASRGISYVDLQPGFL